MPEKEIPRTPSKRVSKASKFQGIGGLGILNFNNPDVQSPGKVDQDIPRKVAEALLSLGGTLEASIPPQASMVFNAAQDAAKTPKRAGNSVHKFIQTRTEIFSSPTPKRVRLLNEYTPTSTRKKPSTISQKLLRILHCVKEENMTLPTFLEELFRSGDSDVAQRTGTFYENKGVERVLKVWDIKLRGGKWDVWCHTTCATRLGNKLPQDGDFVNSSIDIVINRSLNQLENNEVRKGWRLLHTKVTGQKITNFLLDDFHFLPRYAEGATYLTRLLKGLLKEEIPDQKLSRKS